MTLEMVASNTCVGFECTSPLFVHLHDTLHDFISVQWSRHGGLLRNRRNAGSHQSQRRQKPACVRVRTLEKRNHHFLLHGKPRKATTDSWSVSLAYESLSRVQTVISAAE